MSCRDDSTVCFLEQDTDDQLDWRIGSVSMMNDNILIEFVFTFICNVLIICKE